MLFPIPPKITDSFLVSKLTRSWFAWTQSGTKERHYWGCNQWQLKPFQWSRAHLILYASTLTHAETDFGSQYQPDSVSLNRQVDIVSKIHVPCLAQDKSAAPRALRRR